jgi:hypothetical protein
VDVLIIGRALAAEGVRVVRPCFAPTVVGLAAGAAGWLIASAIEPPALGLALSLACVEVLYLAGMLLVRRAVIIDLYRLLRRTMARHPPAIQTSS